MPSELGEIILERTFDAVDKNGNQKQVKLLVGKPHFDSNELWSCPHQIVGIGNEKVQVGRGEDSIQALMLSLQFAHLLLLYRYNEYHITWMGQDDLCLPPLPDINEKTEDFEGSEGFEKIFNEFFQRFTGEHKPDGGKA